MLFLTKTQRALSRVSIFRIFFVILVSLWDLLLLNKEQNDEVCDATEV